MTADSSLRFGMTTRRWMVLFGTMPVSVSDVITAVAANFLHGAPRDAQTASVKHSLDTLGASLGLQVLSSSAGEPDNGREWRLDLAWWQPGNGTVLAAECEWRKSGDILRKFEKLLAIKAPLKLME